MVAVSMLNLTLAGTVSSPAVGAHTLVGVADHNDGFLDTLSGRV